MPPQPSDNMTVDAPCVHQAAVIDTAMGSDVEEERLEPIQCTTLDLLQVLQPAKDFWEHCPIPIPAAAVETLSWDEFHAFRRRVDKVTISNDFWDVRAFLLLKQLIGHLHNVLLPNLRAIELTYGTGTSGGSLVLFRSPSVRSVTVHFEPAEQTPPQATRQQVHAVLEEVATAFPNATQLVTMVSLHRDGCIPLKPTLQPGRFTNLTHITLSLPIHRPERLGDLFAAISAGLPQLLHLDLQDDAVDFRQKPAGFHTVSPLLGCRRLQFFRLHLYFGFRLSPDAWYAMAMAWPELKLLRVYCDPQVAVRPSTQPTHFGSWSTLEAIAASPFFRLQQLSLPLSLALESPPLPPLFHRQFSSLRVQCIQSVKPNDIDTASQFLGMIAESPNSLRIVDHSDGAEDLRRLARGYAQSKRVGSSTLVMQSAWYPIPQHAHMRCHVRDLAVIDPTSKSLPVVSVRPSQDFDYRDLSTADGISRFTSDCDAFWLSHLSGDSIPKNTLFGSLDWQRIVASMTVGIKVAYDVDLWLPRSAVNPTISMPDLAVIISSQSKRRNIKIGVIDTELCSCIEKAFQFATSTFHHGAVLPTSQLVAVSMSAHRNA